MSFKFKQYQYYIIIGVVSVIALLFLPLIGSEAGLAWKIPDTLTGWTVFVVSKLIVAAVNILIFHCFNMQGKENVKEDPLYIEALSMLDIILNDENYAPKAPEVWSRQVYGKKGVTVFCTSLLSTVGLTQAVLTFDFVSMFTYLFTITMGIVFGILQMDEAENYWTHEFWRYAKKIEKETTHDDQDRRQGVQESRGTGTQE